MKNNVILCVSESLLKDKMKKLVSKEGPVSRTFIALLESNLILWNRYQAVFLVGYDTSNEPSRHLIQEKN